MQKIMSKKLINDGLLKLIYVEDEKDYYPYKITYTPCNVDDRGIKNWSKEKSEVVIGEFDEKVEAGFRFFDLCTTR